MQRHVQGAGNGVLPAILVASQEHGEALLEPRWMRFAQHSHDFGIGEPLRDLLASAEAGAEFCAGDVERADAGRNFVVRPVLVAIWEIDHLLKWDDLDAEFVPVLFHSILGVVRAVEIFARGILAWTGMVPTNNEVGRTVVFADDGVPDRFTRSSHTHGQR